MIAELITFLAGLLALWLWCRRDARQARCAEDRSVETLQSIRADMDRLIELERADDAAKAEASARKTTGEQRQAGK